MHEPMLQAIMVVSLDVPCAALRYANLCCDASHGPSQLLESSEMYIVIVL